MTLDELIRELNEIKKKKGGSVKVMYGEDAWSEGKHSQNISDVEYVTLYKYVRIS